MKKRIPITWHPAPSFASPSEHPDDIAYLVKIADAAGFQVSAHDVGEIWFRACESLCVKWISPQQMEASATTRHLIDNSFEIDDVIGQPSPPSGHASWLDYAIDCMEAIERLLKGSQGNSINFRQVARQAACAELNELRLKAEGFLSKTKLARRTNTTHPLRDIVSVETLPGFNLRLTFDNGEVRRFKMSRLLAKGGTVFKHLRKRDMFDHAYVENGTVCWPGNVDLDPELLYEESVPEIDESERRIGVAKGLFEVPDELTYPRDPEWEALPEVGAEVWPSYSADVAAWASAQSAALRQQAIANLDWTNVAEEILGVGKAEERELGRRVSAVMFHLSRNKLPLAVPRLVGERLLQESRKLVAQQIARNPSLERCLSDDEWLTCCWSDTVIKLAEIGLSVSELPEEESPWRKTDLLNVK